MESSEKISNNDEVNYSELIDVGRKLVTENKNYIHGEYYLNLSLLAPNIDSSSKLQALAVKSYIYFSLEKNLNVLLHLAKKILKPESKIFYEKNFDSSIYFCFVRMFYRAGNLCEQDNPLLALYLLKLSREIIIENPQLKGETGSLEIIEKAISNLTMIVTKNVK
jgi:hypothetical protein